MFVFVIIVLIGLFLIVFDCFVVIVLFSLFVYLFIVVLFYYDDNSIYPFYGMRNARIIGYTTYRSGPGKF